MNRLEQLPDDSACAPNTPVNKLPRDWSTARQLRRKSRWTLLVIAVMPLLAIAVALALFYFDWRPGKPASRGELLTPPISLANKNLRDKHGALTTDYWRGKWSLTLARDAPCGVNCRATIQSLARVRVSLAKEMQRIRILWLGANVLRAPSPASGRAADLHIVESSSAWESPRILLIDPLGNIVIRYEADAPAQDIRADLYRLLKYSWVG